MNYQSYINDFIALLRGTLGKEVMMELRPTTLIEEYCIKEILEELSKNLFLDFESLFRDQTIKHGKTVNFLSINGYSDSSEQHYIYNETDDEFYLFKDYFYCRGEIYKLFKLGIEGKYILNRKIHIHNIVAICDEYQKKYEEFNYVPPTQDPNNPEPVKPKIEVFWDENFSEFNGLVRTEIDVFKEMNKDFDEIPPIVEQLKTIIEQLNYKINISETSIRSTTLESTEDGEILFDIFSSIGYDGFNMFDDNVSDAFQQYLDGKVKRSASSNYLTEDDEYNVYLRMFVFYEIAKSVDYYGKSTSILNRIKELKKKYEE